MTETDRVVAPINIEYEGNLDFNEIYHLIKAFFDDRGYDIDEKKHHYSDKGTFSVKWEATHNVNDYTQFDIEISVKGSKVKKVKLKKKEAFSGKFVVEIESVINKDRQDYYEGKPVMKFFRELFDFTVKGPEMNKFNIQVKDETYALFDEVKAYLGLQKIQ
tara:strand:+ start:68 stop:550 length:483 start_codon:yes stop_codon:yes gene_type:complete